MEFLIDGKAFWFRFFILEANWQENKTVIINKCSVFLNKNNLIFLVTFILYT